MDKEILKEKAKQLPLLPGVYLMKDTLDNIIYVGKSKALKRRVSSYFGSGTKPKKVQRMVRSITDFEVRYTDTELEALLLECRLIKQIKPLYNRLLKQDHRYRYLYLNPTEARPRMRLVREQNKEQGYYFGPYERGSHLFDAITLLNKIYHLPDCKQSEFKENCLTYKRGQCIGPCSEPYDKGLFKEKINELLLFLKEEQTTLVEVYEKKMHEAAEQLEFEKAMQLKEEWQLLKSLQLRKEAMQFAKSNRVTIFKLPIPLGGEKLFIAHSYQLMVATKISEDLIGDINRKEDFIEQILSSYQGANPKVTDCLEKALVDEVYILYSYLKNIPKKDQITIELESNGSLNLESIRKAILTIIC